MAEVKTNLRLPEELYEAIKRLAEVEYRSINGQIVALLHEAVARRGAAPRPKKDEGSTDE